MRLAPVAVIIAATLALAVPAVAQQPAAPAGKPYKPVAVAPPADMKDAELTALRDKIAEATRNRDRPALGKLAVGKGFFWDRDGKDVSRGRSAMDALSAAFGLSKNDGVGWDMLGGFADLPTVAPSVARKGAFCAPGEPRFDAKAFEALLKETQTTLTEWTYPLTAGVDVRATPTGSAPVIEKLGLGFVRVLPESASRNPNFMRVLTPSGKAGFAPIEALATYGNDQLCFTKEAGAWKIGGFIGAGEP